MTKKEIILKKENGRIPYLTELLEDNKIGTNTILCKTLTGLGATYSEIKAPRHSIIIEPNRPVITGKCKDPEHKNDNLFGVYQGIFTDDIIEYIEDSDGKFLKIMTTPESFHKVEEALKAVNGVKSVSVSLEEKKAQVALKIDVPNESLKTAVEDIGFEVTNIE